MAPFVAPGPLHTPVLMIIFNRPDTTRQVFEAVRKAKPPRLYIAADGPRRHALHDEENCRRAKEVVANVDWKCEVKTLYHEKNLNCGVAPSTAITWFFQHEEEGIILEDDCLPSQSFFWFCQELLERYRDDDRVMHIGGNNFLNGWRKDKEFSYYFSRSGHIWGWATWRRAWSKFDFKIKLYDKLKKKGYFDNFFLNPLEKVYRMRWFDKTVARNGSADWWDYQWDFARFAQSGLAIVPEKNLVKNLGFDQNATHTKKPGKLAHLEANDISFPLVHPPFTMRDVDADKKYFQIFIKDTLLAKIGL